MSDMKIIKPADFSLLENFAKVNKIDATYYDKYPVKRGLRNDDGTGVIAGVTNISNVHGYIMCDGDKTSDRGRLTYRGFAIEDLLSPVACDGRFCFEEIAYLLLMGDLPTAEQLAGFIAELDSERELPDGFTAHYIMNPATPDIMNALARSILFFYATDANAESRSPEHEIRTAISLISRLPRIAVLAYYAKQVVFNHGSMIMHRFIPGQSTAETILSMIRINRKFEPQEAAMLDIMLALHAEHGGGNNSTFATRVLSSADTDPYSAYAAGIGSLKGSRHGGANAKVRKMQENIKTAVKDWENDDELASYLASIIRKEAFDGSGLIYGMGHAVYTLSDPRATICKQFASKLAIGSELEPEYRLLESIERLAPQVFADVKGSQKAMCANIDMYSGFVYSMLGIPDDMVTPLFACARMAGWAAHRFEEIVSGKRIIRPAYKSTNGVREYVPIKERIDATNAGGSKLDSTQNSDQESRLDSYIDSNLGSSLNSSLNSGQIDSN
ncbi:MAG: citrate synthase [Coriobacteriales bacterium]|jgi:citrate synthase|nr:citrate synthase [Coriobacteriales bacterium]